MGLLNSVTDKLSADPVKAGLETADRYVRDAVQAMDQYASRKATLTKEYSFGTGAAELCVERYTDAEVDDEMERLLEGEDEAVIELETDNWRNEARLNVRIGDSYGLEGAAVDPDVMDALGKPDVIR